MLKVYATMLCPDCVECCRDLQEAAVPFEILDIQNDLTNLKAFLAIRDREAVFDSVRQQEKIGVPCLVQDDGTVSLSWDAYVSQVEA